MKIFKRENILILTLILGAVLGIIGIPQYIGITSDQLLLALLGVLAVDTLVERLGYLERIEKQITKIESKLETKVSADDLLHPRSEIPPMTLWLTKYDEIWLAGISLHTIVHSYGRQIESAAQSGKRLRFLLANPENTALWDTFALGSFTYPDGNAVKKLATDSLALFEQILKNSPKNSIEIRLLDYDFSCSYVIGDGKKDHAKMAVEYFSYKVSAGERHHMIVSKRMDTKTFSFHFQQFEAMWKNAKPFPSSKSKRAGAAG